LLDVSLFLLKMDRSRLNVWIIITINNNNNV
jgi:hypothetical protein